MIRRAFVDLDHGQIHVRLAGNSGQTLLLLHQVSSSSRMFARLMPTFAAAGYRVVAMDLPGLGDSDPPPHPYTIPEYARTVVELVDALSLGAPVAILGHHTGSLVSAELAAGYPERVSRLVLIGLPYYEDAAAREARWNQKRAQPIVPAADLGHLRHEWERLRELSPETSVELLHRELVDTLKAPRYDLTYRAVYSFDAVPRLPLIRCPTLVVAGTRDVVYHLQAAAAAAIPNARLSIIEGGGVFQCDEKADELGAITLQFLQEDAP